MALFPLGLDFMAHAALRGALRPGMLAVDATAGNGHDTLFLASCVGPEGRVWAFDVQAQALAATRARLEAAPQGELAPVTLVHAGHETLSAHLPPQAPVGGAVFNLGYLPGSDKSIVTRPETTIPALLSLMERLLPGGVIALHVYTGHGGGMKEYQSIIHIAEDLPYSAWQVLRTDTLNKSLRSECLLLLQRAA